MIVLIMAALMAGSTISASLQSYRALFYSSNTRRVGKLYLSKEERNNRVFT